MGRYEDWLEEEGRLAKECDYQSPSEADEELRARYEHNKREVDQAEFEAYEEALGVEAGPIHIMYAGRRGSMRVRVLVRDPDLRAGSNAGCKGSLGMLTTVPTFVPSSVKVMMSIHVCNDGETKHTTHTVCGRIPDQ